MELKEKLQKDLVAAMKAKDELRLSVLRMIRARILEKEKSGADVKVDDAAVQQILLGLVKQHKDSIEEFTKAGRADTADKERAEMEVVQSYLPDEATDEEIEAAVSAVIAETGAEGPRDIGKVMGPAMGRLKATGKIVDGKKVNEVVRRLLSA